MENSVQFLELVEEALTQHGGDLGGWTKLDGEKLQVFDGRVTLTAEIIGAESKSSGESVHIHLFAMLHEHEDEVLDACLFGFGDDHESALKQALVVWITSVAGPIKSFLDNKPICMTCQAGVVDGDRSKGYMPGNYGLPGLRAYVGPAITRGFDGRPPLSEIDDDRPWFRFAAESAAPRRVHLAKVTILSDPATGWRREMEIDGHEVSHVEQNWAAGVDAKSPGYIVRFAVFEFPRNSHEITRRAEVDRTIRHFATHYVKFESVDALMDDMLNKGFDPDLVQQTESISSIAFGRVFFEKFGASYSPTIIRAMRDGKIETDVPLMSLPAYSRARAIAGQLSSTMKPDEFQAICFYNAESHAILQAIDGKGQSIDLSGLKFYPCIVPDRGVDDKTMDAAIAKLNEFVNSKRSKTPCEAPKKPWWKFW
jgi:hypothetical protein